MNSKANIPAMLLVAVGALLVWCGLTDRNPLQTIKSVLSGGKLPAAGSASPKTPTGGNTQEPNTSPFPSTPALPPAGGNPFTLGYQTPQGTVSV